MEKENGREKDKGGEKENGREKDKGGEKVNGRENNKCGEKKWPHDAFIEPPAEVPEVHY